MSIKSRLPRSFLLLLDIGALHIFPPQKATGVSSYSISFHPSNAVINETTRTPPKGDSLRLTYAFQYLASQARDSLLSSSSELGSRL
jgi:hypothetical protein